MLCLSCLPDGEVSLDQFLLESVSLVDGLLMMLQDSDAILQLVHLLLRHVLHLSTLQHLYALVLQPRALIRSQRLPHALAVFLLFRSSLACDTLFFGGPDVVLLKGPTEFSTDLVINSL